MRQMVRLSPADVLAQVVLAKHHSSQPTRRGSPRGPSGVELLPLNPYALGLLGDTLQALERFDEAQQVLAFAGELDAKRPVDWRRPAAALN